jgi:hypothetical protein
LENDFLSFETELLESSIFTSLGGLTFSIFTLLGAGDVGQSTIFKHLVQIYGGALNEEDRKKYITVIRSNLVCTMNSLVTNCENLDPTLPPNQ